MKKGDKIEKDGKTYTVIAPIKKNGKDAGAVVKDEKGKVCRI